MKKFIVVIGGILLILVFVIGAFVIFAWAPERPVSELKGRWAKPPSIFVNVAGMSVHLRDEGPRTDRKPIVLLHGTSSSLHTWEGWAQALKNKHRVIRFDLPGFGLTGPSPENIYTIESYSQFVIDVLDKLRVESCVLAGNSFGGYVSWVTAAMYPDRVKAIILVDASGYKFKPASVPIGFRIARMPVLNRLAANILPRSLIESSLKNVYGDPGKVNSDLIDLYFDIAVRKGNRHALLERFKQSSTGEMAHRINEIKAPTLILWGGRDRLIPLEIGKRFNRDIANSQLVIFDNLGHVPQEEDPIRTVAEVDTFVSMYR
jgi:pimeloyl-ACP methyl ester carboxylesterase